MKTLKSIIIICVCLSMFRAGYCQQMTGYDVMKENNKQYDFSTEKNTMTMELINSNGQKRIRSVARFSQKDENKNIQMLIRFLSPADVKGSGYLSIEHSKTDESRYLYLPALKKSRRISTGEDSDNFMGSDFTYEDLDELDLDKLNFKLTGSEKVEDTDCYVVEVSPNDAAKKTSGYSKRVYFVNKETFVVHRVDFYDKRNTLFKNLTLKDIKPVYDNKIYRPYTWVMQNLKTKHQTVLKFQYFKINEKLDDDLFTVRSLERAN
jgi:outer membrane lipoprotein-sorting protein